MGDGTLKGYDLNLNDLPDHIDREILPGDMEVCLGIIK
jgi:hypothetical protein